MKILLPALCALLMDRCDEFNRQTAFHVSAARGYDRALTILLAAAASQFKVGAAVLEWKEKRGRLASEMALSEVGKCIFSSISSVCLHAQQNGDPVCSSTTAANVHSFASGCNDNTSTNADEEQTNAAESKQAQDYQDHPDTLSVGPEPVGDFGWRQFKPGTTPRLLTPKHHAARSLPADAVHEGAISPEAFIKLHLSASRPVKAHTRVTGTPA